MARARGYGMNPKAEALKARTKKFALSVIDFVETLPTKIGLVLEETDESLFWLELTDARSLGSAQLRTALLQEADELTAIFTASSITIRESLNTRRR